MLKQFQSVFYCIADASCGDQAFAAIKLTGLASADFLVCEMLLNAKVPRTNFSVSLNESSRKWRCFTNLGFQAAWIL